MTAPLMDAEVLPDVDDDFAPACDVRPNWENNDECGQPASWYAVMRCCSAIRLVCDHHVQWYSRKPGATWCTICHRSHPSGTTPWSTLERL